MQVGTLVYSTTQRALENVVGVVIRTKGYNGVFVDYGRGISKAYKDSDLVLLQVGDKIEVDGEVSEVSELATDSTIGIKTKTSPCWWISAIDDGKVTVIK